MTTTRTPGLIAKLGAVIIAAALTLTGCSGGAETKSTYTKSDPGVETTMIYYAKGDTVTKQTTKNVLNYEEAGLVDKETAQEQLEAVMDEFEGIEGLEHSVEYGNTEMTETLSVDYEKADISEIAQLTGSSFSAGADEAEKISLKESKEQLEAAGFTEVK